jgi:hypothetical protein
MHPIQSKNDNIWIPFNIKPYLLTYFPSFFLVLTSSPLLSLTFIFY